MGDGVPGKIVIAIILSSICFLANADELKFKNGQIRYGLVIRLDENVVEFHELIGDQTLQLKTFSINDIQSVTQTIDKEQLLVLSPDDPEGYRDYAEILMAYDSDPFAKRLAQRLYFLTAFWGRGKTRRSGFLGLISCAHSVKQEKRIRALAYQLDSNGDLSWLSDPGSEPNSKSNNDPFESQIFRLAQAIRKNDFTTGQELIEVITENRLKENQLGWMIDVCKLQKVTHSEMLRVLELEIQSRSARVEFQTLDRTSESNSVDFTNLDFKNVTDFDPNHCYFRNGEWTSEK